MAGTADARRLLAWRATGAPGATLKREASASLRRLERRVAAARAPDRGEEYEVLMSHAYAARGEYAAAVTLTDATGVQQATSTVEAGELQVGEAALLTVTARMSDGSPVTGWTPDGSPNGWIPNTFIEWGDGNATAPGPWNYAGGVLTEQTTHTYAVDSIDQPGGVYRPNLLLLSLAAGGQCVTVGGSVEVTRPPATGQMAALVEGADGTVAAQQLATFQVPESVDPATEYQATVQWGDGSSSVGTVTAAGMMMTGSGGVFQVTGGHAYATAGAYHVEVDVTQAWDDRKKVLVLAGRAAPPPALPPVQIGVFLLGTGQRIGDPDMSIDKLFNDFASTEKVEAIVPDSVTAGINPFNATEGVLANVRTMIAGVAAGRSYQIDIFGYSRGGALADFLADRLYSNLGNPPIPVNFLALLDPVTTDINAAGPILGHTAPFDRLVVPTNVRRVWVGNHTASMWFGEEAVTPATVWATAAGAPRWTPGGTVFTGRPFDLMHTDFAKESKSTPGVRTDFISSIEVSARAAGVNI